MENFLQGFSFFLENQNFVPNWRARWRIYKGTNVIRVDMFIIIIRIQSI